MNILYVKPNKINISKWKSIDKLSDKSKINILKIGEPLTMEYLRFKLISNKFDYFGKTNLMIINHLKSVQSKDISLQSIIYNDDEVKPLKLINNHNKEFSIGPFSPDEYGNPIFYYTPSYINNTISITTKIWNIKEYKYIKSFINILRNIVNIGSLTLPYMNIIDASLGISSKILTSDKLSHIELMNEHVIEFNPNSSYPILIGKYICIPDLNDINIRNDIITKYKLIDNLLVRTDGDKYIEYDKSYFIIELKRNERPDLCNFDFTASAAELLSKLNNNDTNNLSPLLNILRNGYDFEILQKYNYYNKKYMEDNDPKDKEYAEAYYKQLKNYNYLIKE